jgi:hypothetical protein
MERDVSPGASQDAPGPPPAFSLVDGGPMYRLARALHVAGDGASSWRLAAALVALTWVPYLVIAFASRATPITDYAAHVRFLVAIPLLVLAERVMHERTRRCLERLGGEGWTADGGAGVARIAARAMRLRDHPTVEVLLLGLAVVGSQLVMRDVAAPLGVSRGIHEDGAAGVVWFTWVSLPIYQFLVYRWLWRWAIWSHLLWKVSRLELLPIATHPDRQGGLGFLSEPSVGFAVVVLAIYSVQAALWADRLAYGELELVALADDLAVLLLLALAVALGPLLVFYRVMWRSRFEAVRQYDRLAARYTRLFHARWIEDGDPAQLLGTPDLQSLADLGGSYDVMAAMRIVPIAPRAIAIVTAAALLPMIPLVLMQMPLLEVVKKVGEVVLGGLPG